MANRVCELQPCAGLGLPIRQRADHTELDCCVARIYGFYGMYNWEAAIEVAKRAGCRAYLCRRVTKVAVFSANRDGSQTRKW